MKVLIPIPQKDFDPTEVAVPWKILTQHKIEVRFATPAGTRGEADQLMLTGERLGIFKESLRADKAAREAYQELLKDPFFNSPFKYDELKVEDFDGLLLPGGHAAGMREYLESDILQRFVSVFFQSAKPIGAICHGVVLAARSTSPETGKSILHNLRVTALPRRMELLAWNLTRLWLGNYYRTYVDTTVEDEVIEALAEKKNFSKGPLSFKRDSFEDPSGFVIQDRNFLSARWPGDAYKFGFSFLSMLENNNGSAS